MKSRLTIIIFTIIIVFSGNAIAGFQGPALVEGYDVGNTGKLVIRLAQVNSCGTNLYYVGGGEDYYSSMLSITIAAHVAGNPLNVWVDGCSPGNEGKVVRMIVGNVW